MTHVVAAAFALALVAASVPRLALAQPSAGLVGRVTGADTLPVRGAIIRATLGSRTLEARSGDEGAYRIGDLSVGTWIIAVRRVGYSPVVDTVVLGTAVSRRDFRLSPLATTLDPVLVASRWVGIRGSVVDARTQRPLDGAFVQFTGARGGRARSDSAGRFSIERIPGTDAIVRVRRAGYATRVVMVRVPRDGYAQVEVALDSVLRARSEIDEGDLDSRLRWMSPRAGIIDGDEIDATGSKDLLRALEESPTMSRKGLIVNRKACLFVNGIARPGWAVDALPIEDIEMIEVFPPKTEQSGTLAIRWPKGARCGAAVGRERGEGGPGTAQFVSVWTRKR